MGVFRFDDFQLDPGAFVLKSGADVLPMQPKAFDVLRYLVEHRGSTVTKSELLDALWRNEVVSEAVISWSISHIRRALGQARGANSPIETVHGRGYRFTAKVSWEESAAPLVPAGAADAQASNAFVGREKVIADLHERVRGAAAGRGALCVLTGEAGIGKTRCAQELTKFASRLGVQTLFARCPQPSGAPAMWPLASMLSRIGDTHPDIAARARQMLRGEPNDQDAGAGPEATRFSMIEQMACALRGFAGEPTLLVVDDVHQADESTLRVLGLIAPELPQLKLCVLLTLRDSEREPGSSGDAVLLQLLRDAHTLPLGSLDAQQVAELINELALARPSDSVAQAVQRVTDGVPLFVREVVRLLVLEHGRDAFAALSPEAVRVPELARDLLRQRIRRLPEETSAVLSRAAVIGESFDLSLLAALVELEPEVLLDRLEPALKDGQIESVAPHKHRFVHALFQTVLYADLSQAQRVAVHRKVGTVLEARQSLQPRLGELARHYYLSLPAGQPEKVLEHASAAGDAAAQSFEFEQAITYYRWALEAQGFSGYAEPRVRAQLLLSLALAQRNAGRARDATEAATQVIELAEQHNMYDLVVKATRLRRPTVVMAIVPDPFMRSALERVLDKLPEGQDGVRISALAQLAFLPPYERDLSNSQQLSARAVALAECQSDRELLFEALRARLFSLSGPDHIEELLLVAERMLALDRQGPRTAQAGDARRAKFAAHMHAGRIPEADAALNEMASAIPGPHWPEATFYNERLRAQRVFLDGRFDEAQQRWEVLHGKAVRSGVSYADYFRAAQQFQLTLEREGPAAVVLARKPRGPGLLATATLADRLGMARVAANAGQLDIVRKQLAVVGDPDDYPRDGSFLNALSSWATCAVALHDLQRSEQLLALLSPYAALNTPDTMGYYLGSVAHFLGLLSAQLRHDSQAVGYFEQALVRNRSMGYRAGVVRTLLAHAKLERARGRDSIARKLLSDARDEAQAIGMRRASADAAALLKER